MHSIDLHICTGNWKRKAEMESRKRKRKVKMVVKNSCTWGKTGIISLMSMFKHEL